LVLLCCVVCVCVCLCVCMYVYTFLNLPRRIVIYKRRWRMRWMQLNFMEMGSKTVNWFVLAADNNLLRNLVNVTQYIVSGNRWTISGSTGRL